MEYFHTQHRNKQSGKHFDPQCTLCSSYFVTLYLMVHLRTDATDSTWWKVVLHVWSIPSVDMQATCTTELHEWTDISFLLISLNRQIPCSPFLLSDYADLVLYSVCVCGSVWARFILDLKLWIISGAVPKLGILSAKPLQIILLLNHAEKKIKMSEKKIFYLVIKRLVLSNTINLVRVNLTGYFFNTVDWHVIDIMLCFKIKYMLC